MHYGEVILAKIWKLEKTVIRYSSYTNHSQFSLRCHHHRILPKDLQLKGRIKTERSKTMIYIIHKILVLLKITRILKRFLRSIIFVLNNFFHNI